VNKIEEHHQDARERLVPNTVARRRSADHLSRCQWLRMYWIRILLVYPNVAAKQGVDFQRAGDDTDATVENTLRDLRRLLPISLE